jgi:hypothetical protein
MQTKSAYECASRQAQARPPARTHTHTHTHTQKNTMKAALIWKSQRLAKIVRLMHISQELIITTRKLMYNKTGLIILKILHYME